MRAAIMSLYDQVLMQVKAGGGRRSEPFASVQGVRQGDPLSPTLFGLFIEILHELLTATCRGTGPTIGQFLEVLELFYADDVILMATSPSGLQRQLDTLQRFCELFGMKVNVAKTEVIIFRRSASLPAEARGVVWRVEGQNIRVVDETTYLGNQFHAYKIRKPWATDLMSKATKACMALKAKCVERRITSPELMIRLFDILVEPAGSYGCQVWAPAVLSFTDPTGGHAFNEFDRVLLKFLRYISGCSQSTPRWVLMNEHSCMPAQAHWVKLVGRFWGRLVSNPDWLAHAALRENFELAKGLQSSRRKLWCNHVLDAMAALGLRTSWDTVDANAFADGEVAAAVHAHHARAWDAARAGDPATATGEGTRLCCYHHWIYDGTFGAHVPSERGTRTFAPYLSCLGIAYPKRRVLARLRAGCWPLAVHAGRFDGTRREGRLCTHCAQSGLAHIETEAHALLSCPRYDDIRARYAALFSDAIPPNPPATAMRRVINHPNQALVANCVHDIYHRRFEH